MKKHSVSIRGHKTSFSMEEEFWNEFKRIAKIRKISIAQLVTQIDANREEDENLSSAIRLFVLHQLQNKLDALQI